MPVQFTCSVCGITTLRSPSRVPDSPFCSRACRNRPSAPILSADGLVAQIELRAIDGSIRAYALVDASDADWVSQWRWSLNTAGYPYRYEVTQDSRHKIFLHQAVLPLSEDDGLEVDHISRDKLDNRRGNLRGIPHSGNSQNRPNHSGSSSRFRGVHWHKGIGKWVARITVDGRTMNLGVFTSEEAAAETARAARRRFLPFATD